MGIVNTLEYKTRKLPSTWVYLIHLKKQAGLRGIRNWQLAAIAHYRVCGTESIELQDIL